MSRGTFIKTVRIPEDLEKLVLSTIKRRNANTREKPWEYADFIRIALLEKVNKMNRSAKRGGQLKTGPVEEWIADENAKLQLPGDVDDFDGGFYCEG